MAAEKLGETIAAIKAGNKKKAHKFVVQVLIPLLVLVRRLQLDNLLSQRFLLLRAPVVAVAKHPTRCAFNQVVQCMQLVNLDRCPLGGGDHAWPTDAGVKAEPIERLLGQFIKAVGRFLPKQTRALGAGKVTGRLGEAVDNGNLLTIVDLLEQRLPEPLFGLPKVGHLTCKARSVHGRQLRKEVGPVTTDVVVYCFFLVKAQEFADDFHRQYLALMQRRLWTALPQALVFEPIVSDTENVDDK